VEAERLSTLHPDAGFRVPEIWEPEAFIQFTETAAGNPIKLTLALEIQNSEWELLMQYCAQPI
jgi:hypothetical protein